MLRLRLPTDPANTALDSIDDYIAWVHPFQRCEYTTTDSCPQFAQAHSVLEEYTVCNDSQRESTKTYALRLEATTFPPWERFLYTLFIEENLYVKKRLEKAIRRLNRLLLLLPRLPLVLPRLPRLLRLWKIHVNMTWEELELLKSSIEWNRVSDEWVER
jgi:hypothetical protein